MWPRTSHPGRFCTILWSAAVKWRVLLLEVERSLHKSEGRQEFKPTEGPNVTEAIQSDGAVASL